MVKNSSRIIKRKTVSHGELFFRCEWKFFKTNFGPSLSSDRSCEADSTVGVGRRVKLKLHLFILQTIVFCLAFRATAQESVKINNPHHQGLLSSLNLGFRYSSVLENRGAILYRDFQIDPIVAAFFLDDRLEFLGDSIGYRDFVLKDRIRLRTRLVSITDKPLFPAYDSIRLGRPSRADTYEWSNQIEIFLPGYNENYKAEIDLSFAKDLFVHYGNYLNLQTKFKLFEFRIPNAKIKVEPNFFSSIGWGDSAHNQYFYGPSANSAGLNNISYGFWFAFPEEADRFYPIIKFEHFQVLDEYRNAEFSNNNSEGWLFSFIATYGVFE